MLWHPVLAEIRSFRLIGASDGEQVYYWHPGLRKGRGAETCMRKGGRTKIFIALKASALIATLNNQSVQHPTHAAQHGVIVINVSHGKILLLQLVHESIRKASSCFQDKIGFMRAIQCGRSSKMSRKIVHLPEELHQTVSTATFRPCQTMILELARAPIVVRLRLRT